MASDDDTMLVVDVFEFELAVRRGFFGRGRKIDGSLELSW
jgi:hypothetical protein